MSRNGEVTTTARFAWGTDMAATVLAVRERLDNARAAPRDGRASTCSPATRGSDPSRSSASPAAATSAPPRWWRSRCWRGASSSSTAASVAVTGVPEDEIRVELDPARLRGQGLTPDDVVQAITAANVSAAGGTIRRGQFRFSVRALTELRQIDEFADIPVGASAGRPGGGVRLRDLGTVSLALAEPAHPHPARRRPGHRPRDLQGRRR
ncbi:MAG: efflux RND transporter permease subunit [Gemmatimonadetes bacterium]|nr:efflux RND transporter permease subunit [Gemmatimonadota bacterium]